jgi:hypothetical protein
MRLMIIIKYYMIINKNNDNKWIKIRLIASQKW